MFLVKKYYLIVSKDQLIIHSISDELLKILNYTINDLKNKHVSVIFPKYFLYLNSLQFSKNQFALLSDKNSKSYAVKLKIKLEGKNQYKILLKFVKNKALEILSDYQLFFNKINHAANFGIIIFNENGYVVHCNEKAYSLYGYDYNEFIGIHGTVFIDSSIHKYFYQLINETKINEQFEVNSIEIRKDGSTFKSHVLGRVVETKFGKFAIALVFDITKQTEINEELSFQNDLFRKIFELSPIGYFIYNDKGIVTDVNNELIRQLEVPREKLIGLDLNMLKDKRPFENFLIPIKENKKAEYIGYYSATNSNKTIYTKALFFPFTLKGKPHAFGMSLDLTKEKKYEQELIEKQKFYKTIIETSLAGIAIIDLDENLIFVNKAFANILGYGEEDIINTNLSLYCLPEQYLSLKKQTNNRKQGLSNIYEATFIHRNGNYVHLLMHSSPYFNAQNEVVGGLTVMIDISYQQLLDRLYNKLLLENKALEEDKINLINSVSTRLKSFLPSLLELYKFDKSGLSNDQINEINKNIKQKLFMLNITFDDIKLITNLYEGKMKSRRRVMLYGDFIHLLHKHLQQIVSSIPLDKNCEIFFDNENINVNIEIDETNVKILLEKIVNNFIFKNNPRRIKFTFYFENNFLCIKTQILNNENNSYQLINNFDSIHLCYVLVKNILELMKGEMINKEQEIIFFIPYNIKENRIINNEQTIENIPRNEYSTFLWEGKQIGYFTKDISIEQLLISFLKPFSVNLIKFPTGANIIYYFMRNSYVDIIFLDQNILDDVFLDYIDIIKKFAPSIPIILLMNREDDIKKNTKFDDAIYVSESFENELLVVLSKYLDYGRKN